MKNKNSTKNEVLGKYKDTLLEKGAILASTLQVRFGLPYIKAKAICTKLKEDKEFVKEVRKYKKELPVILKRDTDNVVAFLKKNRGSKFISSMDIMASLGIGFSQTLKIICDLQTKRVLEKSVYYKIK